MALLGTHIRFALDIKNDFKVKNIDKYISGTIYPDSRYISKVDRKITHCVDVYDEKFFGKDDFKKGWMVHMIYDRIQADVFKEIFPELFEKFGDEKIFLSPENWGIRTGLKILQDLDDILKFPIKNYLKCLDYFETPNNEKNEVMKEYNKIILETYIKDKVFHQDSINMWIRFGLKEKLIELIKEKTEELILNKNILKKIPLIYPATLKRYKEENEI